MLLVRCDEIISNNLRSIVGVLHLYYLEDGFLPQLGQLSLWKAGDQLVGNSDHFAGEVGLVDAKVGKTKVYDKLRKVESNLVFNTESGKVFFLHIWSDKNVEVEQDYHNQNENKTNGCYFEASIAS